MLHCWSTGAKPWEQAGKSHRSTGAALTVNRDHPYEQIADLWTSIFQRQEMPHPPSSLRTWAAEAIAAMPTLPIDEDKRAHAWSMLVSLYYKSLNPDWDGHSLEALVAAPSKDRRGIVRRLLSRARTLLRPICKGTPHTTYK
ncbi:MAG TPA: hypothetical protein VI485_06335 [Vicinamibacterales bacterium]|nr:hypothetical protein [Vicinamibacterales bacterium]